MLTCIKKVLIALLNVCTTGDFHESLVSNSEKTFKMYISKQ